MRTVTIFIKKKASDAEAGEAQQRVEEIAKKNGCVADPRKVADVCTLTIRDFPLGESAFRGIPHIERIEVDRGLTRRRMKACGLP